MQRLDELTVLPPRGSKSFSARHGRALRVLAILALLGVLALFAAWPTPEQAGVLELSPAERAGLFERTTTNLNTVCAGPSAAELADFCQGEAELLVKFPECDAACRELAQKYITQPSR